MAKGFSASVKEWSAKAQENLWFVVMGSIQDTAELMTRRQASVKQTGGTFMEGFVPVDDGELISSVVVTIGGSNIAKGAGGQPPDFSAALAGMNLGDLAQIAFTAPHARPIEYGFRVRDDNDENDSQYAGGDVDVPGRFFVRNAVQQWGTIVAENAAQFKD